MKKPKVQNKSTKPNQNNLTQFFQIIKKSSKKDLNISPSKINCEKISYKSDTNEENLECSICLSILHKPITLLCNHTFCESCLEKVFEGDSKCPLCRKNISKSETKRNYTLQKFIKDHHENTSNNNNSNLTYSKEKDSLEFFRNYDFYKTKCLKCRRPLNNQKFWKDYCTYCYAKQIGQIVKCSLCPKRLPVFPNQLNKKNYCVDCYKKRKGNKGKCTICNKFFYYMPLTSYSITECEKCYLKKFGEIIDCVDCGLELNVLSDQVEWKNRCYECWLDS